MPHTRRFAAGSFTGHRLVTGDTGVASAFYARLFDWSSTRLREVGEPGTMTLRTGDRDLAVVSLSLGGPAAWLPSLVVPDLAAAVAAARASGGQVIGTAVERGGECVEVSDPSGARFCLTVATFPRLGDRGGVAGPGRFCWDELFTPDPVRAAGFYAALAGWGHAEWDLGDDGRYWLFRHDGRDVAGMMSTPAAGATASWVPYVQVVSAEQTAAQAARLGATIVMAPGDVPGRGRFAVLRDPQGALVAVFALTEAA